MGLTTEDEPDDDFQPTVPTGEPVPAEEPKEEAAPQENRLEEAADAQPAEERMEPAGEAAEEAAEEAEEADAAQQEEEEEEVPEPDLLTGAWRQLEGTPRPATQTARFLCWNDYGHVSASIDGERQHVEVRFASAADKPHLITDYDRLDMAAMGPDLCALASSPRASEGIPSRLLVRPCERWDKPFFTAALGGESESVEAIACGKGFVAAVTSWRVLRVYGPSGLPLALCSLPGPGVALAARGSLLFVVTRAAEGSEECEYRLMDVHARAERSAGRLPISTEAGLRWIGISSGGQFPVTVDTDGEVRALLWASAWGPPGQGANSWMPMGSLAAEEAKAGPLWAVYCDDSSLWCATASSSMEEPRLNAEPPQDFGLGTQLQGVALRLPLGPVPGAGIDLEESLRGQLLARQSAETAPSSQGAGAGAWHSKIFGAFGKLVQAGHQEAALDVARHFLAGELDGKLLNLAADFAEKAGLHKLTDAIRGIPFAEGEVKVPRSRELPRRRAPLPPLFPEEEALASTPPSSEPSQPTAPRPRNPISVATAPAPAMVATSAAPAAGTTAAAVSSAPQVPVQQVAAPKAAAPKAAEARPPAANPFARVRRPAADAAQAPHFLRDALGAPATKVARTVSGSSVGAGAGW
mmetsp:Transcript_19613/g.42877  ORF Transcript_19613/g.42877 Transcript_19613/m.42877 type:complete len:639 (-) Transcript_19613:201-2117(-)